MGMVVKLPGATSNCSVPPTLVDSSLETPSSAPRTSPSSWVAPPAAARSEAFEKLVDLSSWNSPPLRISQILSFQMMVSSQYPSSESS
jgi:hypothetical protein